MGSFWDSFGIVLGSFWNRFGVVLKSFWDCFKVVLGSFWDRFAIVLGSFWDCFGIVLGSFWDRFGIVLGPFWDRFGVGGGRGEGGGGVKNSVFLARAATRGHPYFGSLLQPSGSEWIQFEYGPIETEWDLIERPNFGRPSLEQWLETLLKRHLVQHAQADSIGAY